MVPRLKHTEFARILNSLVGRREPFAVATDVRTEGSSLGKPGFKELIAKGGETVYGALGRVCPEYAMYYTAQGSTTTGHARTVNLYLERVARRIRGTCAR